MPLSKETRFSMTFVSSVQPNLVSFRLFFNGGLNQVQIHSHQGSSLVCQGQYELACSEHEIVLLEWLSDQRVLAVDSWGKLYLWTHDPEGNGTIKPSLDLQLAPFKDAWVRDNTLWLAAKGQQNRRDGKRLIGIELSSLQVVYDSPLGFDFEEGTLFPAANGDWVCYQRSGKPGYKFRTHATIQFSTENLSPQCCELASKPPIDPISVRTTLFIDKANACLLCADTSAIDVIHDEEGVRRYSVNLQLIDLRAQQLVWSKPARYLSIEEIADEYDREEIAESLDAIAAGDITHQHNDAWQQLLECLTDVQLDSSGDHYWLAWQGGHVQCVSRRGNSIGPLLAFETEKGRRFCAEEESYLLECINQGEQTQLLLAQGDREWATLWRATVANVSGTGCAAPSSDTSIVVEPIQARRAQVAVPVNTPVMPMESGQVNLFCADLQSREYGLASLNSLLQSLPALQAHYEQIAKDTPEQELPTFFCFAALHPQQVEVASEYMVFPSLAIDMDGTEMLARLIDHISQWSCCAKLVGQAENPVLADAVLTLADKPEYLPTLTRYFQSIAPSAINQAFHCNRTLKVIREVHADSEALSGFEQQVPWPWNDPSHSVDQPDPYDDW